MQSVSTRHLRRKRGLLPKRRIEQTAQRLTRPKRNLLSRKAQHSCERDDGDKIDNKNGNAPNRRNIVDGDADRGGNQQDIEPRVEQGAPDLVSDRKRLLGSDVLEKGAILLGFALRRRQVPAAATVATTDGKGVRGGHGRSARGGSIVAVAISISGDTALRLELARRGPGFRFGFAHEDVVEEGL